MAWIVLYKSLQKLRSHPFVTIHFRIFSNCFTLTSSMYKLQVFVLFFKLSSVPLQFQYDFDLSPHCNILPVHQHDVTFKRWRGGGEGPHGQTCSWSAMPSPYRHTGFTPHFFSFILTVHWVSKRKGWAVIAFWVMFVSLPCFKVNYKQQPFSKTHALLALKVTAGKLEQR